MTLTRTITTLSLILAFAAPGCANPRWQETTALVAPADGTPAHARFYQVVDRVRLAGYVIDEIDEAAGFVRVRAHLGDGGAIFYGVQPPTPRGAPATAFTFATSTQSWLTVMVGGDGSLRFGATGHAVREDQGKIHRRLLAEMERFAAIASG